MNTHEENINYLIPNMNSAKHHFYNDPETTIEMWLADMDFSICDAAKESLSKFIDNGDFGYGFIPNQYYESVLNWIKQYHNYGLEKSNIYVVPGVITAIYSIIYEFTEINDCVAFFSPTYHAFRDAVFDTGRNSLEIPLKEKEDYYEIDYSVFEELIKITHPKILIFNNPHNPTGTVFSVNDLQKMVTLAKKYNFLIISDEIHMDFVPCSKFESMINLFSNYSKIIVLTAPTKTFNIAGAKIANVIIGDFVIGKRFKERLKSYGIKTPNTIGISLTIVCYEKGSKWLKEVNRVIEDNYNYLLHEFGEFSDSIRIFKGEGTYFAWLKYLGAFL
ncbi:MAG: aminotransferase class I/II-fold pyridoxal phosphate-dependent enzyme [Lachnospiraceae bacterium]|nr:aminotransferase class I/II-fold pyridoxal phosphate-dependent enzyme [Lachnospiraceae bacterium]